MSNTASAQRRWLAMLFLTIAFGMMVWGRTFLTSQLQGVTFAAYWIACVLAAAAAVTVALVDMVCTVHGLRVHRRHQEQRWRQKLQAKSQSE